MFNKNQKVQIGYFKASIENLEGFKAANQECEACNEDRTVFVSNPNSNVNSSTICIDCLKSSKIEASHNTSFGYVVSNIPNELESESAKKFVTIEAFQEMLRTPSHFTLQGEQWLCHCNDFMDYLGIWEAHDFTKVATDNNGRKLYLSMTNNSYSNIWDNCNLSENELSKNWDNCLYHAFECRHCKIKKGYWEA